MTIKVPLVWNHGDSINEQSNINSAVSSEVHEQHTGPGSDFPIDSIGIQNSNAYSDLNVNKKPIPAEYFEYNAQKPQFAVDVAIFHDVKSPEKRFRSSPILPYRQPATLKFETYQTSDKEKLFHQPSNSFIKSHDALKTPVAQLSSNYEIFHPYKNEEPALRQIYKDPVLQKIRNDIRNNKNRLQKYENNVGEVKPSKEDYLKSPDTIDKERFPHNNEPTEFENHQPQRRPIYYKAPRKYNRNDHLNKRFRHPLNQNYIKIRPAHYRPLQTHIHKLKKHQGEKYDDEHNEYPQVQPLQNIAEQQENPEGYDIYEQGKEKYVQLRNNVDDAINKAVLENTPQSYQHLELQNNEEALQNDDSDDEDDDEFVPIKNYAQVRKTETTKHLPRSAALEEATSYDEIENAPRLREAIKSTKAQTVYTEEGYEDSAYDHAGEQKHASDHEAHGGYLKQNEMSKGKFKVPSVNENHQDGHSSAYTDATEHGKKWKNADINSEGDLNEDYYKEYEEEIEDDLKNYNDRENDTEALIADRNEHEVNKREVDFQIPELKLDNTYLTEKEIIQISKEKIVQPKNNLDYKYPYYKKLSEELNKNSPLRYAENLSFIPKKTNGGTEFYDSRKLECSEVDEDIDPTPKQVKDAERSKGENDSRNENNKRKKREADFNQIKAQPRLKGLGNKIDCFKAKYFGENPLDSPFFTEEIIVNPEPITIPPVPIFIDNKESELKAQGSNLNNVYNIRDNLREENHRDLFNLIEKLKQGPLQLENSLRKPDDSINIATFNKLVNETLNNETYNTDQSNVYTDIIQNIRNNNLKTVQTSNHNKVSSNLLGNIFNNTANNDSITYSSFNNKEDITRSPIIVRRKRSTSFVYEPYKVIRDTHINDSKKTATLINISPLIKQLQSSRVVDMSPTSVDERRKINKLQPVKRNVRERTYKDIRKEDRNKNSDHQESSESTSEFVDVNEDKRRGEPRYEILQSNHKNKYKPVENKKSMSIDDYKSQTRNSENDSEGKKSNDNNRESDEEALKKNQRVRGRTTTLRPYFDVSQYLPTTYELQKSARSKNIENVVTTTISSIKVDDSLKENHSEEDEEDSDEEIDYEEEDDDDDDATTTTTTTTIRSPLRIRRPKETTTLEPRTHELSSTAQPRLKLVTRFRNTPREHTQENDTKIHIESKREELPFTERSRKSSKSTLVTDSKSYGEDDNDMKKDIIDSMIGLQQNMDDYIPEYEKQEENKSAKQEYNESEAKVVNENSKSEIDNDEDYEDVDDDENDNDDDYDDEEEQEMEDKELLENHKVSEEKSSKIQKPVEAEIHNKKYIESKKKLEIHDEIPVNKSSHMIQFKQDIVEEEVVKRIPQKNLEALELYKDEKLANQVNKLQDVEIFRADLNLEGSPKHGGNYRRIQPSDIEEQTKETKANKIKKDDPDTSQSKNEKLVELNEEYTPLKMHGGNLKLYENTANTRFVKPMRSHKSAKRRGPQKSAKYELDENSSEEIDTTRMHGGNLKSFDEPIRRTRINFHANRNTKTLELDEVTEPSHVMHGGNLRSRIENKYGRSKGADVLNSFAQAVPILTTTPPFILDPSKRMYFYVEK